MQAAFVMVSDAKSADGRVRPAGVVGARLSSGAQPRKAQPDAVRSVNGSAEGVLAEVELEVVVRVEVVKVVDEDEAAALEEVEEDGEALVLVLVEEVTVVEDWAPVGITTSVTLMHSRLGSTPTKIKRH
jgi:hypothetical protein